MKKVALTICIILLLIVIGCQSTIYNRVVIIKKLEPSDISNYKYRYEISSSIVTPNTILYSNHNYNVGDTMEVIDKQTGNKK